MVPGKRVMRVAGEAQRGMSWRSERFAYATAFALTTALFAAVGFGAQYGASRITLGSHLQGVARGAAGICGAMASTIWDWVRRGLST